MERSAELLTQLIRNACVNDESVDETPNADALRSIVEVPGVDVQAFDAAPGRRSLVARWPGTDPAAPSLLLLTHTDVVPADPSAWRHDPFGGDLIDGEIWGRGALDMLNYAATMAYAFGDLARSGRHPRGDVIFAATADEEMLGTYGVGWLMEQHPDAISADWVLTESGGLTMPNGGISVLIADKGAWRVELVVRGEPGHASMPWGVDSAVALAAEVIRRLCDSHTAAVITEPWKAVVRASGGGSVDVPIPTPEQWDAVIHTMPPDMARVVQASTHMTVTPTSIISEGSWNTIAPVVRIGLDVRTLTGQSWSDIEGFLLQALGSLLDRVEVVVLGAGNASSSPVDTPLWRHVERATARVIPGASLRPSMGGMITDARYFREHGATAYGVGLFDPTVSATGLVSMIHGIDERISLTSLDLMDRFWAAVLAEFA